MADIKIYGRLVNATTEAEIAQAEQIIDHAYDGGKGKKQSDINAELKAAIDGVDGKKFKTINGETITGEGDITIDLTLYKVVTALPTEGIDDKKIYLVKNAAGKDNDVYTEYVYVTADKKWEKLGEYKSTVDLTPYALKSDLAAHTGNTQVHLTADEKSMLSDLDTLPEDILSGITAATQKADSVELEVDLYHKGSSDGWQDDPADPVVLKAATKDGAGVMTAADKVKLDGLKNYTLPAATEDTLGGVVVGPAGGLNVDEDGTLTVKRGAGNEVIEFGGIEDGEVTIEQNSYAGVFGAESIVYNPTKGGFLLKISSGGTGLGTVKYYQNWEGAEAWGEPDGDFWQAVAGTLYVDVAADKVYRFDGAGLAEVAAQSEAAALTDAEIDEICK